MLCCSFHVFTTVHDDDWSLVVVISIDQSNARTEKNINKVGTRTLLITKPHNMNKKFQNKSDDRSDDFHFSFIIFFFRNLTFQSLYTLYTENCLFILQNILLKIPLVSILGIMKCTLVSRSSGFCYYNNQENYSITIIIKK